MLNLITKKRDACKGLVGKPEGLRAPEMSIRNQEDNIGMGIKSHEGMLWTGRMWLRMRFIGCPCEGGLLD